MPFKDITGAPALPTLTPDGNVPVEDMAEEEGDVIPSWANELIWELRALRRAYCEETDQPFDEYPG